ncbi:TRAP transporter large permease subunit [Hyphobacterium sp. CCMP332]|nr:TRAP transporter large permease subunit [Hyphobacterium sp. CCMP332]
MEYLAIIMFLVAFGLLLYGFPVAFTLGGTALFFGFFSLGPDFFYALPLRIFGTMNNYVLIAAPLFIYMGIMLEKSGLAATLLETMALLFGRLRGGLAISVVLVGAMLAASTGIVGATVVTMGLISLPTMLKRGYHPALATGTVAASGTLGQIIPPSVVLVLLGSVLNVSVGELFKEALIPGLVLVALYLLYIAFISRLKPDWAPVIPHKEIREFRDELTFKSILMAFVLPFALVATVLGTIFAGIASPTEAAAVGGMGAILLTAFKGKLNRKIIAEVNMETMKITSMVFMIFMGATAFSLVFRGLGGDHFLSEIVSASNLNPLMFLIMVMLIVFLAGFFIDFIEIIFIIVPVVLPIFKLMGFDLVWIGILLAINLQTSFLTPPFGFALFYLKGVAPSELKSREIYKGAIPFVVIQMTFLIVLILMSH